MRSSDRTDKRQRYRTDERQKDRTDERQRDRTDKRQIYRTAAVAQRSESFRIRASASWMFSSEFA
jgi:hypothetical protein